MTFRILYLTAQDLPEAALEALSPDTDMDSLEFFQDEADNTFWCLNHDDCLAWKWNPEGTTWEEKDFVESCERLGEEE